jgi:hypothetical protein
VIVFFVCFFIFVLDRPKICKKMRRWQTLTNTKKKNKQLSRQQRGRKEATPAVRGEGL